MPMTVNVHEQKLGLPLLFPFLSGLMPTKNFSETKELVSSFHSFVLVVLVVMATAKAVGGVTKPPRISTVVAYMIERTRLTLAQVLTEY